MRIPGAWDIATGTGVVVAVIDTGITAHPDLDANILPGYDFISDATAARDGNGRDTNPNDQGDWYAADECGQPQPATVRLARHPRRRHRRGGRPTTPSAWPASHPMPRSCRCACWASAAAGSPTSPTPSSGPPAAPSSGVPANANPAEVINMSLGGGGSCGTTYQTAINGAVSRGTTVVVAAGNSNHDVSGFHPGQLQQRRHRGRQQPERQPVHYSNYGATVDLTAPGGDISASPAAGSSPRSTPAPRRRAAATPPTRAPRWRPRTSPGLVALMQSKSSTLTPAQVEATLKQGTRATPGPAAPRAAAQGSRTPPRPWA